MTKDAEPDCILKSRFSVSRLRDIIIGLKDHRRKLIIDRGWGVLLDICAFSAPKGLLEWIISRIDAELGEFRNSKNKTSIVFNKEMVVKALGLPRGTRPVVLTGENEESPYRDFYKIEYKTAGRRAPIYHAEKILEDDELDPETWFRTFFMVVIGTYFFPGTSIMLPLEYLGSLGDSTLVREYDWAEKIFTHTMSEIKCFQEKKRQAEKDKNLKQLWVGSCLPWIAIVYMDHLDFPVSTLSTHRINYGVPRASHVSDADFKFVMKHDKSKLTLMPHIYGERPFRPFHLTPYADVIAIVGNQAPQAHNLPQIEVPNSNHLGQDETQHPTTWTNNFPEELPDYIRTVNEKHANIWSKDVERLATRFMKLHGKRMAEYASDLFAAFKNNTTGGSSAPSASTPIVSPPRASTPINGEPTDEAPALVTEAMDISDPFCSNPTQGAKFWEEASRIAAEVEQSAGKKTHMNDPSSSTHPRTEDQDITETAAPHFPGYDSECPTFNLLPNGETWTQHLADINHDSSRAAADMSTSTGVPGQNTSGSAYVHKHPNVVRKTTGTEEPQAGYHVASEAAYIVVPEAPIVDACHNSSSGSPESKQPPINEGGQSSSSVADTIGTQTQEKKNRKKRAFLDRNSDANQKKLKNLKVTDKSKEVYDTYILRRCIRKPVEDEERPPFVDFGEYHVTYEEFREALKPRGRIDKNVMELYIRHFNLVTNIPTTGEPLCTKFAFSQHLTTKLIVHEDKFEPSTCLKEFQQVYKDHQLKTKDMLYFLVLDNEHWVLVCINLLLKKVNVLDYMIPAKKARVYEKAHFLVNNFVTLVSFANAFPKTNFGQFVQNNPQELRQQTTLFDCGIFVMIFMKQWDGKIMKPFSQEMIDLRMVITYMILKSNLNKVDPTWVLKNK